MNHYKARKAEIRREVASIRHKFEHDTLPALREIIKNGDAVRAEMARHFIVGMGFEA